MRTPNLQTKELRGRALFREELQDGVQATRIGVVDDELLALAAPQVVALVRRGPHEAERLFVSLRSEPRED